MKTISAKKITGVVSELYLLANHVLRRDVLTALKHAYQKETGRKAKAILQAVIKNAYLAEKEKLAICQDTGMPCVFLELGQDVRIIGDLKQAINKGVEAGYKKGFLRNSIILDPLSRGKPVYQPAIIHIDLVRGNKLKIIVLPKGFGCENKTQLKMFKPTAGIGEIKRFVVDVVRAAGPDACPPYVVGVGIGGTADYACFMAKKALLRNIIQHTLSGSHRKLEKELLKEINQLGIGPMGLSGETTALSVNIETYPTHIAGLPVCVNISCHALRSASETL